ncbi:MAG: DNA translocase FtsK 4TM domain-containing protein [Pseudarcicella sp.]|nr:DNA translocase FtsK 4TM domain-containing protein [Pseudarcicella sp.]MBP6409809.1 DNA translocase FtsK 4TM domain-containing protein [Pseudarcicella sp.]
MAKNIPRQAVSEKTQEDKAKPKRIIKVNNPQLQLALGVMLILLSVFLLISIFSHFFTGNADQSELNSYMPDLDDEENIGSKNFFGHFGAVVSDILTHRLFGVFSLLLVPITLFAGFKLAFNKTIDNLESFTYQSVFYMIWGSLFLGFWVYVFNGEAVLGIVCGGVGYLVNQFLYEYFANATLLVIFFILFLFIVFYYKIDSLSELFSKINGEVDSEEIEQEELEEEVKEAIEKKPKNRFKTEDELSEKDLTSSEYLEDDLILPHEDNDDVANIRPILPPILTVTERTEEPEIALTIETNESVESEIHIEEETPVAPLDVENETVNEELLRRLGQYDPTLDLPHYKYPDLSLLKDYDISKNQVSQDELKANSDKIVETLRNYSIGIASIKATIGPTVTLYEIIPEAGVRISKIKNLEDDIALSLAALGIRIIAPIPGKGTIGIEVPNKNREMVPVKMVISSEKFQKSTADLPIVLGKTISNDIFVTDLAKMPHLLMAGATGQGKSVGLNMLLVSLLYKKHPSTLKFVLVDPKKVELTLFNKIERHFLAMLPDSAEAIITDTKKVVHTLNSLCIEMDNRYNLLKDAGCRNLKEYNLKFINRRLNPEKGHYFMPYIVLVIDELADLMMTAGKEVEQPIARLAQLARAIGIHLVIATQRPSVNVITGTIKANFPARLSFKVTSKIDSRTILDAGGAEQLVGQGDMLLSNGSEIIRLQCAFVDTPEVDDICDFVGNQQGYDSAYLLPEFEGDGEGGNEKSDFDPSTRDSFFDEAARLLVTHQQGSTSLVQRRLKLGYNRAGRIIDQMEAAGILGPFQGSKVRDVLIPDLDTLEIKLKELNNR